MKKYTGILILIGIIAIVVIQLGKNKQTSKNRIYQYDKEQVITVHSQLISQNKLKDEQAFSGVFEADREVKINTDIPGKVIAVYIEEGENVKKGQLLAKLDDLLLRNQLKTIKNQINGLEIDVNRYTILTEADAIQGVKLEKIETALRAANIQRETVLEKIQKTSIRAPFKGVATKKMTEVGSYAAPGMPLFILTNISELKFTLHVTETDLNRFNLGTTHRIIADSYPDKELIGEIEMIGSKGNMGNSFPVQFVMKNTPKDLIKSKMFGTVSIGISNNSNELSIPSDAVIGSHIEPQVYVIQNGIAKLKNITISRRINNVSMVSKGLNNGDEIITAGFINLFDGANVTSTKN